MTEEDLPPMQQGYSGSTVRRVGRLVEKTSSDEAFTSSPERQRDLIALAQAVDFLPFIQSINGPSILMEYITGQEGISLKNAFRAGQALRQLHDQSGYPHPCQTGIAWLVELANANLAQAGETRRIAPQIASRYPADALIHSEPVQLIEKPDGSIVFIDFEGIGMGSRYHDLGQIYLWAARDEQPEMYHLFIQGYQSSPVQIEPDRVVEIAGLISLAYAGFGLLYEGPLEFERRLNRGLRWLAHSSHWLAG